jgi:site-specific DNA-methyltransferase (adenine-specific)
MFTKGNGRFHIQPVRFPHEYCAACRKSLRDWGGKAHLMNPTGYAISDVWKSLPPTDNYHSLSLPVLDVIFRMVGSPNTPGVALYETTDESAPRGLVGPCEGLPPATSAVAERPRQQWLPGLANILGRSEQALPDSVPLINEGSLWNIAHHGDAVEVLRRYPNESVDLLFADPPYNLDKAYNVYNDEQRRDDYLAWCNSWLQEYIRILKPTGSLYLLNLPRWSMYHAAFLNQRLHFQNWIVWDALSEPRGKLMPAHYGLLYYTKHPTNFTFNYGDVGTIDARHYCLRADCIRKRKQRGEDDKEPLTDIWTDVHRIKHRRDRDYHPCQLPDGLLERIIRLSTNPGDVVLDALAGTGTTVLAAARLGRRYVAIDIDATYVQIIRDKLRQVEVVGHVQRDSVARPRPPYSKKALQLELQDLATRLGHLPTPEDVKAHSHYDLQAYIETFPTWGKALKAAKLVGEGRTT